MNPADFEQSTGIVREALSEFLGMLLGKDAHLNINPPQVRTHAQVKSQLLSNILVFAQSPTGEMRFAVRLENEWLPLLSQAMLGEAIDTGNEGAADLIREVAAQGFGAVRNRLASINHTMPDEPLGVVFPGQKMPKAISTGELIEVDFELKYKARSFSGSVFMSSIEQQSSSGADSTMNTLTSKAAPSPVNVAPASFPDLGTETTSGDGAGGNFHLLAEVELEITVELGRRRLPLADMLRLTTGSVIELEKFIGEPLEVYANGRLIAEGEAVVIDEQFGIRITSFSSTRQRTKAFL